MKTVEDLLIKVPGMFGFVAGVCLSLLACSTVKEQGEPDVITSPNVITNDVQRQAVYERGADNVAPQNANPIPTSEQLGLDEKASEINRKKNIEAGGDPNIPANTPTEQRPRELRDAGNDTIYP